MNKTEFLNQLQQGLSQLPEDEIRDHLEYYEEMISDRMEDGMTEQQALEALGDPRQAARQILAEMPLHTLVKTRIQPEKGWSGGAIALVILGAPLWVPLVIAAVSVVCSLYLTVWSLVLSLYAVVLSLGVGGIAAVFGSIMAAVSGWGAAKTFMGLGAGLLSLALCCLGVVAAWYVTLAMIRGTRWSFGKIKNLFVRA